MWVKSNWALFVNGVKYVYVIGVISFICQPSKVPNIAKASRCATRKKGKLAHPNRDGMPPVNAILLSTSPQSSYSLNNEKGRPRRRATVPIGGCSEGIEASASSLLVKALG